MCQSSIDILVNNDIHFVKVPSNCKDFIKSKFIDWYSMKVLDSMNSGETVIVSLRLSVIKPLGAQWLTEFHDS